MNIIDRYIFKTVFLSIAMVALVLWGLDLLFAFVAELEDVTGEYQMPQVVNYVLMTGPYRIYAQIPIFVLVGTLLGLGSLASSSELVVMRAAGLSVARIIFATMKPIFVFLLVGLILGQFVVPWSEQAAQSYRAVLQGGGGFLKIKQGNWHREGNDFIHVNAVQPNGVIHGITRYNFNDKYEMTGSSFARRAVYKDAYWLVEDTRETRFEGDRVVAETIAETRWITKITPKRLTMVVLEPAHLSISELYLHANYLRDQGLNFRAYQLEFWKKVFQPLVTIVMVLLASSFIFGLLRTVTVGQRVMVGLVLGIVFVQLQEFFGYGSLVFNVSPVLAALVPMLMFLALALYFLRKNQ